MAEIVFSYKVFNPLFWHIREAFSNKNIRYIINKGGSSSGKSVSTVQAILLSVLTGEGNCLVLRKTGASIRNTVYEEFKVQARNLSIYNFFQFIENSARCVNGMRIDFSGLDDPEKIKSIANYKRILLEEASEFEYEDFVQITFRLRGKEGLQIVLNFNPISEDLWIKTQLTDKQVWTDVETDMLGKVRDAVSGTLLSAEYSRINGKRINSAKEILNPVTGEKEIYHPDTIELHSTYINNFWVVGSPDGSYGYYDRQTIANYEWYRVHDYNFYRIYALGEWGSVKTGGEFLHSFDMNKHVRREPFDRRFPIYISIDDNLLPYISVSFFQLKKENREGVSVRRTCQIHEICAADPFNSVTKAAEIACVYLDSLLYNDVVYVMGDATTRKGNTIDEEKQSFFDKFVEGIGNKYVVREMIGKSNPSVSMTGEFVNAILGGYFGDISFSVDERCKNSIVDYNNTKKDVDGSILKVREKDKKTKQSYERYGHLTDCLRYFLYSVFKSEYNSFSLRNKRSELKEGDFVYYNPFSTVSGKKICYIIPDNAGKCTMVCCYLNEHIFVDDAVYQDSFDEKAVMERISAFNPEKVIVECGRQYERFLLNIRKRYDTWALKEAVGMEDRINGYMLYMKEHIRLSGRTDSAEYNMFVYDVLDYRKDNVAGVNILSAVCAYSSQAIRK